MSGCARFPIHLIVVYALIRLAASNIKADFAHHVAPTTPTSARPTATNLCVGDTSVWVCPADAVPLWSAKPSPSPLPPASELLAPPLKSEAGRAISITPRNETRPASCSFRVKGSWRIIEHTQHVVMGARNVMTVASESARYLRESKDHKLCLTRKCGCYAKAYSIGHIPRRSHLLLVLPGDHGPPFSQMGNLGSWRNRDRDC